MYSWFAFVMVLIFAAVVAWLWREGMWSNAVTLFNFVTAALVATNYWEPLATMIDDALASATYLADFVSIWLIFRITFSIFRAITDKISKVRVRFKLPVEAVGGLIFAFCVASAVVCFTTMTLHTAPLARDGLGGSFRPDPSASTVLMFAPDSKWLGFVTDLSREGRWSTSPTNPFDPNGQFRAKYAQRRVNYQNTTGFLVSPGP